MLEETQKQLMDLEVRRAEVVNEEMYSVYKSIGKIWLRTKNFTNYLNSTSNLG